MKAAAIAIIFNDGSCDCQVRGVRVCYTISFSAYQLDVVIGRLTVRNRDILNMILFNVNFLFALAEGKTWKERSLRKNVDLAKHFYNQA